MKPMLALGMLAAASAAADTRVWVIGGGAGIDNAQGQIESNIRWLEDLLIDRNIEVDTYFALGDEPGKDIVYWNPTLADRFSGTLEPLARIFGEPVQAGLAFRRHDLRSLRGSTRKSDLVPRLRADFARHLPAEDALIVYNGHGGLDFADPSRNYLRLWNEGRLDVEEFSDILKALPESTTARFVMTQCYSGAFHSLIYEDPPRPGALAGGRCGFFSESALEQAEGCSLAVEESEYRDYSTYFFAGLSGTTRLGEPVEVETVDRNGDGGVSFREAHFYALATAHSSDLPRASSEEYLTAWTPWYLEWDAGSDDRSSVYFEIAEEVANRYGWRNSPDALEARRREFLAAEAGTLQDRQEVEDRATSLREALRSDLLIHWPELAHPYSSSYRQLIETELPAIARHLSGDGRYERLVTQQGRLEELGRELTDSRRHLTQIDKIYRLRKLARLEAALEVYGDARAQREYAELLECESGSLE